MIEIKNLSKSYKKKLVLDNVSLSLKEGEIIGIAGANGSGKSTLLSALARIIPDSGYVPQNTILIEELSGRDNLRLWYAKNELEKALSDGGLLAMSGLNSFLDVTVSKMSGGMKKRLSIGCALAKNPKILLLDEPTSALDLPGKQKLFEYYQSFTQKGGILVTATHEAEELSLCSRVFVLKNGSLFPYSYDGDLQRLSAFLSSSSKSETGEK
ncbi:MAG: ABC transporter ATP-binding protein [Treponema sp.]|nr:ABC transporter ATP-binding protein [Treponema sp.]